MLDLSSISMLITAGGRDRVKNEAAARTAAELLATARVDGAEALQRLESGANGLTQEQVEERLEKFGHNIVAQEEAASRFVELLERFYTNPINILLTVAAVIT